MPNPPKPIERKRRTGNPGKRALPDTRNVIALPGTLEPPEPLRPLANEGRKTWDRIWNSGGAWVSSTTDIELVQLVCESIDERTMLRLQVLRGSDWRDRVALRHLERSITAMLSQLGFSPTDRARMGVAEVRPNSRLDALKAMARAKAQ